MFNPRFRNEKHCREETIGRAVDIAAAARRESRELTVEERRRIDALLTTAEMCLDLRESIPRERDELLAYGQRPLGARLGPFLTKGIEGREARRIP